MTCMDGWQAPEFGMVESMIGNSASVSTRSLAMGASGAVDHFLGAGGRDFSAQDRFERARSRRAVRRWCRHGRSHRWLALPGMPGGAAPGLRTASERDGDFFSFVPITYPSNHHARITFRRYENPAWACVCAGMIARKSSAGHAKRETWSDGGRKKCSTGQTFAVVIAGFLRWQSGLV